MVGVRAGLSVGVVALGVMLGLLDAGPGIGVESWGVGLVCAVVLAVAAARWASRSEVDWLGPADLVTLTRATLACAVACLVAESLLGGASGPALVVLAVVALSLDAVDGRVARLTGTASSFGARLDGEADAFLMLVLSVYVSRSAGAWVVAMGAARYLFGMAGWVMPWMKEPLPARHWRKVVTATAGIALVLAASGVAPVPVPQAALGVAFLLLAESFGRDVWWLWCRRPIAQGGTRTRIEAAGPQQQPSP